MTHNGGVAAQGIDGSAGPAPWSEIEAAAPQAPRAPAAAVATARPIRLRRRRDPVLAALDGAGAVMHRRARDLLVGTAILLVPMVALNLWATTLAFDRLDDGGPSLPGFDRNDALSGIESAVPLVAAVFASLTAALVGVFAASILIGERFARPVGLAAALRTTIAGAPTVAVTWIFGHCWVPFVALYVVRGSDWGDVLRRSLISAPPAAVLSAITLMVSPLIVAERATPARALQRSWALARMRFAVALAFVLVSTAVGGLLLLGIAFLPRLVEAFGFLTFGGYTWLVEGVVTQLGVLLVVPLVALATAQLYLEVRVLAEGMDLVLDADAAFGPRERAT